LDRQGAAVLAATAVAAVGLAAAAGPDLSAIHLARWLAPGADRVRALTTQPTECLRPARSADEAYAIEVGRAAFRSPLLLGGQAARAGVACDNCHRNGRNNPEFDFPGLSGAPGTADVTSALFSAHRDDGIDNPKPIPDLSGPRAALKISQAPSDGALEHFIHGIVREEFEGAEPTPAVLSGVATYVRALSPAACPAAAREPLTPATYAANARRAVAAAIAALDRKDAPTAAFLTEAARTPLGLIDERYDAPQSADARAALRAADLELAAAADAIRAGAPHARERLVAWLAGEPVWMRIVEREAPESLFNPKRLG